MKEMTTLNNNGAFLNSFWDLASDERERRLSAACQIVEHVKNEEGSTIDTDYALKRLVRLPSTRSVIDCIVYTTWCKVVAASLLTHEVKWGFWQFIILHILNSPFMRYDYSLIPKQHLGSLIASITTTS